MRVHESGCVGQRGRGCLVGMAVETEKCKIV